MCRSEKFCLFMPLGVACYFIGVSDLLISLATSIASIILLLRVDPEAFNASREGTHNENILNFYLLSKGTFEIIIWTILIIALLHVLFTSIFIKGLIKNEPSLILMYFGVSIMTTILIQIASLLELIHHYWITAFATFFLSVLCIDKTIVVHTVYERMLAGRKFTYGQQTTSTNDDEDPILAVFDDVNT